MLYCPARRFYSGVVAVVVDHDPLRKPAQQSGLFRRKSRAQTRRCISHAMLEQGDEVKIALDQDRKSLLPDLIS